MMWLWRAARRRRVHVEDTIVVGLTVLGEKLLQLFGSG